MVPDFLLTLAATAATMAAVFFATSFLGSSLIVGDAGRALARLFAAALLISGFFMLVLALGLLRDERSDPGHYVVPALVGAVMGSAESAVFLLAEDRLLLVPFVLLVFILRPVRRQAGKTFLRQQGRPR